MEAVFNVFLIVCMIILAVCLIFCLVRAIKGPHITDRIVAINMIGTTTIIIILLLSLYLKENYLVDVSLLYAMLSFLSVVVLTRIYTGVYNEKEKSNKKNGDKESDEDKEDIV
ncbi:MAG: sodium:proton antiporter [Lachnospiraceae bacterium]|nr:sodium:proton antiporter [Lachnospiraceae bacterium]